MLASVTDRPFQEIPLNTTKDLDELNKDTDSANVVPMPSPKIIPSISTTIAPEEVRPHLKAQPQKVVRRGRPRGKLCILTDIPEKCVI